MGAGIVSRILVVLELALGLVGKLIDVWTARKKRDAENDLQSDVQDIKADPVGYAHDQFGGVRQPEKSRSEAVSGDQADGPDDRTG